jgi:hypothetical protein
MSSNGIVKELTGNYDNAVIIMIIILILTFEVVTAVNISIVVFWVVTPHVVAKRLALLFSIQK